MSYLILNIKEQFQTSELFKFHHILDSSTGNKCSVRIPLFPHLTDWAIEIIEALRSGGESPCPPKQFTRLGIVFWGLFSHAELLKLIRKILQPMLCRNPPQITKTNIHSKLKKHFLEWNKIFIIKQQQCVCFRKANVSHHKWCKWFSPLCDCGLATIMILQSFMMDFNKMPRDVGLY